MAIDLQTTSSSKTRTARSASPRRARPRRVASGLVGAALLAGPCAVGSVQAQSLVNACSGLAVTLPVLTPVTSGLVDPVTNALLPAINTNLTNALSGQQLGVSAVNANGTLVALPNGGNCNFGLTNPNGITVGGGQIDGLGGNGNPLATAGAPSAIAIGNGALTAAGVPNATALGTNAAVTVPAGVALGAGSVANRAAPTGVNELFSGTTLRTTFGGVSVGAAGNERQIVNVAGGTADTDAVNVRQLRSVGTNLATSLGGGANFNATTGIYTAPTYTVGGATYNNVGGAIGALDTSGVKYDVDPATGTRLNAITLAGGDPNTPVLIHNVAAGIANTDAANVGQVKQALSDAKTYTDQQIANALGNVQSLSQLGQELRQVRREARQAAAIGLAAGSLRFDDRPGKVSVAAGGGGWMGEGAAAFGIGYTTPDGFARVNATASTADGKWGVGGGLSLTLN